MPNTWVKERKREFYYRKAKAEKLRSRASYKLLQAVKKYKFIKPGYVVVDLGAAPGGWTQAARQLVEASGYVLAIDLKPIEPVDEPNVRVMLGDITDLQIANKIKEFLPRSALRSTSDATRAILPIRPPDARPASLPGRARRSPEAQAKRSRPYAWRGSLSDGGACIVTYPTCGIVGGRGGAVR